ncbi:WD40 repeat domain-containing protein [Planomonospora algeriensis]
MPTTTSTVPSPSAPSPPPEPLVTSLASPMATSTPLPATGPPRFVVTARAPFARAVPGSKDYTQIPVRPAVHDAATGRFLTEIPLPPGVPSAWQRLAAAPDNRTFALAGWTGPDAPLRLFLVTLDDDGRPGEPVVVPGPDDGLRAPLLDLALSRDGTRLAYAVPTRGGTRVSVVDTATGQRRDWVTTTPGLIAGLSWAPDGRQVAMTLSNWGVGVIDLADQGTDLLAAARLVRPGKGLPLLGSVAYTPDGGSLVYAAGHAIERVPAGAGAQPEVIARTDPPEGASLSLRFSLDGTGRHLLHLYRWQGYRVDLTDGSTTPVRIRGGERPGKGELYAAW